MNGVKVIITKGDFPTPFGLEYTAKGAYVQGINANDEKEAVFVAVSDFAKLYNENRLN